MDVLNGWMDVSPSFWHTVASPHFQTSHCRICIQGALFYFLRRNFVVEQIEELKVGPDADADADAHGEGVEYIRQV